MFGNAIDCSRVTIRRRRWFPFQPQRVTMAPMGHLHFHPLSDSYCDDFALARVEKQGLFIHEMTHVWQAQTRGAWYLPLWRNFSRRYDYALKPGRTLDSYGIEQQAEIVRHAFLLRKGWKLAGVSDASAYDLLVRFEGTDTLPPIPDKQDSIDV
jgi:hypothetical protein